MATATDNSTFCLTIRLPGPSRKRKPVDYHFRLLYWNPDPEVVGCVLLWEVQGGRMPYQIAVERAESGQLRLHCTCADAIFRAEREGRFCKHVRGFLSSGQTLQQTDAAPTTSSPASIDKQPLF